jgi:hypothetical protein
VAAPAIALECLGPREWRDRLKIEPGGKMAAFLIGPKPRAHWSLESSRACLIFGFGEIAWPGFFLLRGIPRRLGVVRAGRRRGSRRIE